MPKRLSEHFTLEEFVLSQTASRQGIDNTPPPAALRNLRSLASVMEVLRSMFCGVPVVISSGYRSATLNAAVGGSAHSAHMAGLAVDFTAPAFGTVMQVARAVSASGVAYDQLIYEYGSWVHLGLARDGVEPRRQNLSFFRGVGYLNGIVGKPSKG